MFAPNQRVKVNLANLTIQGVQSGQNVQEALGTGGMGDDQSVP